jgi:hypothetical protein
MPDGITGSAVAVATAAIPIAIGTGIAFQVIRQAKGGKPSLFRESRKEFRGEGGKFKGFGFSK